MLLYQLYKAKHPKGGIKGGSSTSKGSGFGKGGGGMGDMMGMGKSNV